MEDGLQEGVHSDIVPAQGGGQPGLVSIIPWDPSFSRGTSLGVVACRGGSCFPLPCAEAPDHGGCMLPLPPTPETKILLGFTPIFQGIKKHSRRHESPSGDKKVNPGRPGLVALPYIVVCHIEGGYPSTCNLWSSLGVA